MSFWVNPCRALLASVPLSRATRTRRVVRSTRLPTAEPFVRPLMRSPSQWPGTVRLATSAGRSTIGALFGMWPRRSSPAREAGAPCAPDRVGPAVRCAGRREATLTGPHRWSLSKGVSARPRVRASEAPRNLFGENPRSTRVPTYCHSHGSRSFRGGQARVAARRGAVQAR